MLDKKNLKTNDAFKHLIIVSLPSESNHKVPRGISLFFLEIKSTVFPLFTFLCYPNNVNEELGVK